MSINIPNEYGSLKPRRAVNIFHAPTLKEATRMGFCDYIWDTYFNNGGKRSLITKMYAHLHNAPIASVAEDPESYIESNHENIYCFGKLCSLANIEHKNKCDVIINQGMGNNDWSFSYLIEGEVIYNSGWLSMVNHTDIYQRVCAQKVIISFGRDLYYIYDNIFNEKEYFQARVETMSDDKMIQKMIMENSHHHAFAKENLLSVVDIPDSVASENQVQGNVFVARFKNNREIVFSNRRSTAFEFRADTLKKALSEQHYTNLYELCTADIYTEENSLFRYFLSPFRMMLMSQFETNRLNTVEHNALLHELHRWPCCMFNDTPKTLGELLELDMPQKHYSYLDFFTFITKYADDDIKGGMINIGK